MNTSKKIGMKNKTTCIKDETKHRNKENMSDSLTNESKNEKLQFLYPREPKYRTSIRTTNPRFILCPKAELLALEKHASLVMSQYSNKETKTKGSTSAYKKKENRPTKISDRAMIKKKSKEEKAKQLALKKHDELVMKKSIERKCSSKVGMHLYRAFSLPPIC